MVQGYFVTFFTQQNRMHGDVPLGRWIIDTAQGLGVRGATLSSGSEGFGHDGRYHSESLFDFEDKPLQVSLALTAEECSRLMATIKESGLRIFYTKSRVEFGFTSED